MDFGSENPSFFCQPLVYFPPKLLIHQREITVQTSKTKCLSIFSFPIMNNELILCNLCLENFLLTILYSVLGFEIATPGSIV